MSLPARAGGPAAVVSLSPPIRYSLKPARLPALTASLPAHRFGRIAIPSVSEPEAVRDRFDIRALPFDRARAVESMKAGFQLRVTGDAGGLDTSFDVAGPVPAIMRYALR